MVGRNSRTKRRRRLGAVGSSLTAAAVALSLIIQLIASAHRQAQAAPALAAPDPAAIVAELRAAFGEAAWLCTQGDDKGAPVSPAGDCDDHCPFCQFAAQAATLIAPDAPVLPVPRDASFGTLGAAPVTGALPVSPTKRSRARAPPSAV